MKIELSPKSLLQLEALENIQMKGSGFVFGFNAGQYRVIDEFFPVSFTSISINRIYPEIFERFRDRLIGVFFLNHRVFLSDWFLEQLVVDVQGKEMEYYLCRFDDGLGKVRLVPVQDDGRS
jgi:hypothetical protein